jgi:uncharacterized protein YPO0396
MDDLYETQPERPGFRLQRLELFNWGTFDSTDGQVFRFEPEGRTSLLVGHNGSGKSTLVDAILTLLVEPRIRNYNVAAGARKTERTEKSYLRGAYARTSDDDNMAVVKYLRPQGGNLTAISAVFADEQLGRSFTLCQVLHLAADGSIDKLFAIADESRELQHDLAGVRQADELVGHLQHLGYETTKKFVKYRSWLVRRTGMLPKAMDMFNQTVAVKDIQSLDRFVRDHMLERHDWQESVKSLLVHFHDLSIAHQELVRTRRAAELLAPVEKLGRRYRESERQLADLKKQLDAAETFFRQQTVELLAPVQQQQELALGQLNATLTDNQVKVAEVSEEQRKLKNEIDEAGGERLRALPQLIATVRLQLGMKQEAAARFHLSLRRAGISTIAQDESAFVTAAAELLDQSKAARERERQLQQEHNDLVVDRGTRLHALRESEQELAALGERKSNLPAAWMVMREQLCADLSIKPIDVPFAAELISVDADELRWQASIEMVLRRFALSLLVPEPLHAKVRAYIDRTKLIDGRGHGQRLDYLLVGRGAEVTLDRLGKKSLVSKLKFRDRHPLTSWVRGELAKRFDYECCESATEFDRASSRAITENRHLKYGTDRHTKDDRAIVADPRNFVLGWDNREKKRLLAERIAADRVEIDKLNGEVQRVAELLADCRGTLTAIASAQEVTRFSAIDGLSHERELASLEREKRELETSNDAVRILQRRLKDLGQTAIRLSSERDEANKRLGLLQHELQQTVSRLTDANRAIEQLRMAGEYDRHAEWFASIADSINPLSPDTIAETEVRWTAERRDELENRRAAWVKIGDRMTEEMAKFLRYFAEQESDLTARRESLDSFMALAAQIREEDLPRHEQRFKERLNEKVTQEIAIFHNSLSQERRQIETKISMLNRSLAALEYRAGTFMKLEPHEVKDGEIVEFRKSLRACLDDAFDGTSEANEIRYLQIEKLVARLADSEKARWREKVVDVRNWFTFAAREVDRETGDTRSFHEGSSGQSGGEKAKLAFTILVAAISYQFDLDPEHPRPGRFQFVVVDEMFSKIDDQNAEYALRLFERFGLQLLIVAPLDAKARVTESFVQSYLQVVKDDTTGKSQLFAMTAREYDEVVGQFAVDTLSSGVRRVVPK